MYHGYVAGAHDFDSWREAARPFIMAGIPPQEIEWVIGDAPDAGAMPPPLAGINISVPKAFFDLAATAIQHDDPNRFVLLYALLYIISQDRNALTDRSDPLTARIEAMAREVNMARIENSRGDDIASAWATLREDTSRCRRCDLYRHATQTVFGEGPLDAKMMLVGEQPGDQEDLQGRPFVGPAGQLLDSALEKAGIDRARIYISNAVKHFKFEARGKRRIHSKPNAGEITACRWWIDQERVLIRPSVIIALGATAGQSLLGKPVTISKLRGSPIPLDDGSECHVTVHPSYLLRIDDDRRAREELERFVHDLKTAKVATK